MIQMFISEFIVRKDRKAGREEGDRNENYFEEDLALFCCGTELMI